MSSPGQTFALSYDNKFMITSNEIPWNPHMFPHVPCDFSQLSRKCPMILWWFSRCPMILWWFSYGFFPCSTSIFFVGKNPWFFPMGFPRPHPEARRTDHGGRGRFHAAEGRKKNDVAMRRGGGWDYKALGIWGKSHGKMVIEWDFFDVNVILRLQSVTTIGKWWFNEDIQWYSWILMGAKTFMMT